MITIVVRYYPPNANLFIVPTFEQCVAMWRDGRPKP